MKNHFENKVLMLKKENLGTQNVFRGRFLEKRIVIQKYSFFRFIIQLFYVKPSLYL